MFNIIRDIINLVGGSMQNLKIKNLDITIDSGELVSIIGPTGCGKTTILKMICGKFKNDNIFIDDKSINNYNLDYKRNNIVCVFDDNIYNTDNPLKELRYYLNKININTEEIDNRIRDFIDYFVLENIINKKFIELNTESRVYIKILSLLIINPSLICIDDLLTYLDLDKKTKILNYIKEKNITLINVSSDMEELLYMDKILIMNKGKKEIYDKTDIVLSKEDIFKELGLSLPFIYDINNLLKSYELINENHMVIKELVDLLWK